MAAKSLLSVLIENFLSYQLWQREAGSLRQQLHNLQEHHRYDPQPTCNEYYKFIIIKKNVSVATSTDHYKDTVLGTKKTNTTRKRNIIISFHAQKQNQWKQVLNKKRGFNQNKFSAHDEEFQDAIGPMFQVFINDISRKCKSPKQSLTLEYDSKTFQYINKQQSASLVITLLQVCVLAPSIKKFI